ncbi:MAG: hypothetical protein PHN21_06340, partial [Erysipelotrichaceae bacterium]|nr:hypothetical protein [Erysipelotrichaceae bacterium]
MKRKILVFAEHYLPAVKGGGPIRSIKYIVDSLSDKYDFYIVTTDRDLNDEIPFNVEKDRFIQVDKAMVYYTDINKLSLNKLRKIMNSETFDVIKLNSFFNLRLSIY